MAPELSKNRHLNLNLTSAFSALNTALSAEVVSSFRDVNNSRKKAFTSPAAAYAYVCLTKKKKDNKRKQGVRGGRYGKTVDDVFADLCVHACVQAQS